MKTTMISLNYGLTRRPRRGKNKDELDEKKRDLEKNKPHFLEPSSQLASVDFALEHNAPQLAFRLQKFDATLWGKR